MPARLTLTALAALLALAPARAAAPRDDRDPPEARAADAVAAAYTLARLGRESKSPLLLLGAAQVLGTTPFRPLDPKGPDADGLAEAGALVDEALKLAPGDAAVKELAARVRKELRAPRGPTDRGPMSFVGSVPAGGEDTRTFALPVKANRSTVVYATTNPEGPTFTLTVLSAKGEEVAGTLRCHNTQLAFTLPAAQTCKVTFKIKAGDKPVQYRIFTN